MPYKIDTLKIKLPRDKDRRIKISDAQRQEIINSKGKISIHELSRLYGVSRRLIQFILYPERLELNKKDRQDRGGSKQYYNKDKNTKAVRETRRYRQEVLRGSTK